MFKVVKGLVDVAKVSRMGTHQRGIALLKAFRQAERDWLKMIEETNSHDTVQFLQNVQKRHPEIHIREKEPFVLKLRQKADNSVKIQAMAWRNPFTGSQSVYLPLNYQGALDYKHMVAHEFFHVFQLKEPVIWAAQQRLLGQVSIKSMSTLPKLVGVAFKNRKLSQAERLQRMDQVLNAFKNSLPARQTFFWSNLKERHAYSSCLKHIGEITQAENLSPMTQWAQRMFLHYKNGLKKGLA